MMIKTSIPSLKLLTRMGFHRFIESKLTEDKLRDLKIEYRLSPSFDLFKTYITSTSDYFKIFHLMEREQFVEKPYLQLKEETDKSEVKSDNMFLLRARITARIAESLGMQGKVEEADKLFNEALEIFELSLIPQVLPYYSVYRKYGMFLWRIGKDKEACETLSESVEILRDYVKHSDDPITANYHSIEQAKACIKLVYLQAEEREKWLKMANDYWKECEEGVYDQIEYAQTVYENTLDKSKINPKKAFVYAEVEKEKITNEKYHEIIDKAFNQDGR